MPRRSSRSGARADERPRPALDARGLRDLALRYVARYATTRAKLTRYLGDKLRERGWAGDAPADLAALAAEFETLGYIDDAAFAATRAGAMQRRGYGARRIGAALHQAGIAEDMRTEALDSVAPHSFDAALALARRRRLGPFGVPPADARARDRQLAALLRAGHSFDHARRIVDAATVEMLDKD